jgi:hypothetical protein
MALIHGVDGAKPWSGDRTLYLDRIALRLHRQTTSMYALFITRAHLKARLTVRLTGVPECPLDVPEYPSDGLSYNPSDNGTPERGEPASA